MEITRSFETLRGTKVEIIGKLIEFATPELNNDVKFEIDVIVEGYGSQGGTPSMGKFEIDGIDYVARVGQLALTQDQLSLLLDVRRELMKARDAALNDGRVPYGTYEDVERSKPWLRKTY